MVEAPPGLPPRYRVTRLLGQGGQARTYLARDDETGASVAVKVFELRDADNWKGFELFERECRVLRSLQHPHVVDYIEHGGDEDLGVFYMVMEYAPGPTLEQGIREGKRYTDAELDALLRQLLQTLGYLHSLNPPVFHRDLKPGNVVRTEDGVKLVDFGGVREAFSDRAKSTVVGTFGYMAPEQLRGEASPASDLYGLGATMAAIASGQDAAELPHAGLEIDLEQCMKPGRLRDVLTAMLRADPRQRASSVEEVFAMLERTERAVAHRNPTVPAVDDDPLQHVERLARAGNEIDAIRYYRELTGASLRDARDAVRAKVPTVRGAELPELTREDKIRAGVFAFFPAATFVVLMVLKGSLPMAAFGVIGFFVLRMFVGNVLRGYRSPD